MDYLGITGGGGDEMPRENKYRRCMKEYASPSPPPPPPPPRRRASATVVSDPVGTDQVFEFSYSNRAGLVSIATEPAAQVTCPDTPFPERSSQAAGVSGFTPSRPGVVVDDMCAGSSTSGVLGGGLARQDVGDRPICSPSPARGRGKTGAGRGDHVSDSKLVVAPSAPAAPSVIPIVVDSGQEGSQPAPGARTGRAGLQWLSPAVG